MLGGLESMDAQALQIFPSKIAQTCKMNGLGLPSSPCLGLGCTPWSTCTKELQEVGLLVKPLCETLK